MLLMAAIVAVTGQLTLSARRSTADQQATLQAQYVAESGVARAQARIRGLGTLLSPTSLFGPASAQKASGVSPSQMAGYILSLCNLTTLPVSVATPVVLCGVNPSNPSTSASVISGSNIFTGLALSDVTARMDLFTSLLTDDQLASIGYTVSTSNTKANFFANLFKPGGVSLNWSVSASDSVTASVSAQILGVTLEGQDSYKIYIKIPDVNSRGALASTSGASRVIGFKTDQSIYVLNILRPGFASYGLFTNHQYSSQAAEASTPPSPIVYSQNSNYSGPVHTNQNAYFALSATTNATSPSSSGSTFSGGFSSAGCPANQIVPDTSNPSIDPNTGLTVYPDKCSSSATPLQGAYFNTSGSTYPFVNSTAMNNSTAATVSNVAAGSTSNLPKVTTITPSATTIQPTFGGNIPNWNKGFIPLPANGNSQSKDAQPSATNPGTGGLYLTGTISNMTLAVNPAINLGGSTVKAQTISYTKDGTTTSLAYGADGKMFIRQSNGTWVTAAQKPCLGTPTCATSGGDWVTASSLGISQGTFNGVVYSQNAIASLNGPSRSPASAATSTTANTPPAVASFAKLTVASTSDVNITSDLRYESPPCTGTSVSAPACDNKSAINILGIYSVQGDVVIKAPYGDSGTANSPAVPPNVTIQAVLMASGSPIAGSTARNGRIRVDGYANSNNNGTVLGNLNLLGGMIENYYGAFGTFGTDKYGTSYSYGFGRNIIYDERTGDGISPPSFPFATTWAPTMKSLASGSSAATDSTIDLRGAYQQGNGQ